MVSRKIIVTGGAGFIGSAVCREIIANTRHQLVNLDKLTYAANLRSLDPVVGNPRYRFHQVDIANRAALQRIFAVEQPDAVINLAAESHVDRSIDGPGAFISTNIAGTYTLLEVARAYWGEMSPAGRGAFRFLHVSTDEVFGSLSHTGAFTEDSAYRPNSPYSASKAASDHLVRAWHETYGLPTIISSSSNNYGPYHFPEKLIPLAITNAIDCREIPVYGEGRNVRDWLHVEDHARALLAILDRGRSGSRYNIGSRSERTNLAVVHGICDIMDRLRPRGDGTSYRSLVRFVVDRPGHDLRYAIDPQRIETELGWRPREQFDSGIEKTVGWYLDREDWWRPLRDGVYSGARLGLAKTRAGREPAEPGVAP